MVRINSAAVLTDQRLVAATRRPFLPELVVVDPTKVTTLP